MRKKLLSILIICANLSFAQQTANLTVHDTRDLNGLPSTYNREVKAEFKTRNAIEVPGAGKFSRLLTIAPWNANTGNKHHQLNFNDGGVFYRNALPNDQQWGNWNKFLIESAEGNVRIGQNDTSTSYENPVLRVYRKEASLLEVANSLGLFQIAKSSCNNCFSTGAVAGDTVLRNLGKTHNIIISMPNNNNDGNSYVGINDGANGTWIKFFNNGFARFEGKILAKEVEVKATVWADYVFKKEYQLNTLEEVEKHIKEKGHLPDIPSAEEVLKNGINVAEMDAKLLKKIEELTLYSIDQHKQLKSQSEEINELKKQVQQLISNQH